MKIQKQIYKILYLAISLLVIFLLISCGSPSTTSLETEQSIVDFSSSTKPTATVLPSPLPTPIPSPAATPQPHWSELRPAWYNRDNECVSLTPDGTASGWIYPSVLPAISADGRYVAFYSRADNLVNDDTNIWEDVFVYDRQMGQTDRISMAADGSQANGSSGYLSISADGRYVAFSSTATNLVLHDSNAYCDKNGNPAGPLAGIIRNCTDGFIHDRQAGQTSPISVASNGSQGNGSSGHLSISADGRYVAFESAANNLVEDDTNRTRDVFIHDRQTGQTGRVSVASDGSQGNGASVSPSLSADGRYIAFVSRASNLVIGDTNEKVDVFVRDRIKGQTVRISVASDGTEADWGTEGGISVSADGSDVVFVSGSTNLVPDDTNNEADVFVHNLQTAQTVRVSVTSDGLQGNGRSGIPTWWRSSKPSISADGRYVAFWSEADNLVSDDTNDFDDIFVHDLHMGRTTRVSVTDTGVQANGWSEPPAISADGRYVAFWSRATNLASSDAIGTAGDIFVHDLAESHNTTP